MSTKHYCIYILANKKNGTIYIGVTNNLARRIWEHKEHVVAGFTSTYDVTRLVHYEIFEGINEAIRREKQLKRWNRKWKLELIEETNPTWEDLYSQIT